MINEIIIRKESIFQTSFTGNIDVLDEHINYVRKYDGGRVVSNVGGYQSNDINFGFTELIMFVQEQCEKIKPKTRLDGFWLNINNGQNYNMPHMHDLSPSFSVVYYHKICCENSPISFRHITPCIYPDEYKYSPKNQDIIIFDARIPHMVYPCNNDNHERISIAFNFSIL